MATITQLSQLDIDGTYSYADYIKWQFEERIELELFYAQNWTFWLDIKILFKTIAVVLNKRGAK